MTGGRASLIWLILLAACIALFAGIWLVPHLHRVVEQTDTLTKLETEGARLAARVEDLTQQLSETLASPDEQPGLSERDLAAAGEAVRRAEEAKRLAHVRQLASTEEKLSEAALTIDELQAKVVDLARSIDELREDNRILQEKEQELNDQLQRSNRVVEAMREEMKGNSDLLVKVETRNRLLREQNREVESEKAKAGQLVRNLENLHRRRETILTNIGRRFREVADEYRTVSVRVNSPEQINPNQGVDLSRIQNALTLADEDLRQLRTLNNRANRIQKEITQ